jgi:hypothetical protein
MQNSYIIIRNILVSIFNIHWGGKSPFQMFCGIQNIFHPRGFLLIVCHTLRNVLDRQRLIFLFFGAQGSVGGPRGCLFDSRRDHWIFSVHLILTASLWPWGRLSFLRAKVGQMAHKADNLTTIYQPIV